MSWGSAHLAHPTHPAGRLFAGVQYDIQQVTDSPTPPRADAARLLGESVTVADELIAARREVRLAMLAKSYALRLRAERVEQTATRKQALIAESERIRDQTAFTNADGSPIAKTVDDEWREGPGAVFVGSAPDATRGPAIEKFVAAHPDFWPARMSLALYYEALGDDIKDVSAASAAARKRHFEAADVQLTRALELSSNPADTAQALGERIDLLRTDRLNRPAEAEALARSAISKYPDQPDLVIRLAEAAAAGGRRPDRRRRPERAGGSAGDRRGAVRGRDVSVEHRLQEQGSPEAGCSECSGRRGRVAGRSPQIATQLHGSDAV